MEKLNLEQRLQILEDKDAIKDESGIANIIKSLKEETKSILFAMHSYSNPVIKIDDNTAMGNWLFWVVSKLDKSSTNQVYMSQNIGYIKTSTGWRINSVILHFGNILKTGNRN